MILTVAEILSKKDIFDMPMEYFELQNLSLDNRFKTIKKAWGVYLPYFERQYKDNGYLYIDPYFCDWISIFSHIESMAWNDIRYYGVPLYPQFPALGYFLDFANPFLKIAIECDGVAFHDEEKDVIRDKKLEKEGWTIFRIKGKECNKTMNEPDYWEDSDTKDKYNYDWLNTTSEGVIYAIKQVFFNGNKENIWSRFDDNKVREIFRTLESHCATKNSFNKISEYYF